MFVSLSLHYRVPVLLLLCDFAMFRLVFLISLSISSMISIYAQKVVVDNGHFYSVYNVQMNVPSQVEWIIKSTDLGPIKREPSWKFRNDIGYPDIRATHSDYTSSGYDRGHMCPAADRSRSREAMRSTFVMSNVAPQTPWVNRGYWKATENLCRLAAERYDSVHVLAMPIFLHRDTTYIGAHRVAVPHAFFKVAWLPSNDSIIGVWFVLNK